MKNKVLFRTAFRGFNKIDVASYIEKFSNETGRTIAEKDEEIKALSDKAAEMDGKLFELEEKKAKLENELTEKSEELKAKDELIKELEAKIAQMTDNAESFNMQKESAAEDTKRISELEERVKVLEEENIGLSKKLEEYKEIDSIHHELGTIIMRAEKSASDIISKAQREADETIASALKKSEEALERRIEACTRIAQSFEHGRAHIDESCQRMLENLDAAKKAVDMFYASLESGGKVLSDNISSVSDTISGSNI